MDLRDNTMSGCVDINRILSVLPHRYPFILVDRVLDYKPFEYLKAVKNVTINEPFFTGHFPGNPIMPGVLMLEALAQAGAILSNLSRSAKEGYEFLYFFAGIDNAKFKHIVTPGDQLLLSVELTAQKRDFWRIRGEVFVGDKLACSADLMSAAKEVKSD
jgi:3-hydroxyacyl-[acyl-carrier-protein] dehydratase